MQRRVVLMPNPEQQDVTAQIVEASQRGALAQSVGQLVVGDDALGQRAGGGKGYVRVAAPAHALAPTKRFGHDAHAARWREAGIERRRRVPNDLPPRFGHRGIRPL